MSGIMQAVASERIPPAGGSNPAPVLRNVGATVNNSTGTGTASNTGALPTRVNGDVMIMHVTANSGAVTLATTTAGWTKGGQVSGNGGTTQGWFWRIVDGTEAAPVVTFAQCKNTSHIASFSGVTATPIGASTSTVGSSSNPVTAPALTTTAANSLVLFLGQIASSQTLPTPAGFTLCANSVVQPALQTSSQVVATSGGASSAVSITATTAQFWSTWVVELKAN